MILFIISWIIGIIISLMVMVFSWIKKDKETFETGITMLAVMALTGWITGIALLCVLIWIIIISRFDDN